MQRVLSFDDTPALSIPLRFMLTAPWFAAVAGALLLWNGAAALETRWAGVTLALTHLMTLGFLAMTIAGALLQMLPVVAGFAVPQARQVATLSWLGLASGTPLLAAAFLTGLRPLFAAGALALGAALLVLIAAIGMALARRAGHGTLPMIAGIRLAIGGLAVGGVLGLALAGWLSGGPVVPFLMVVDLHSAWALLGCIGMMVVAVAFQVIVMFEATAIYPRTLSLALPSSVFLLLGAWSVGTWTHARWQHWAALGVAAALALFAGASLVLLARRKARTLHVTTMYWRLSLGSLLACSLLYAWPHRDADWRPLLLGILFIAGFAASAVNGMLYRIVPFLLWYHLAAAGVPRSAVPGVNAWIAAPCAKAQFWCHAAALAALTAATIIPMLARPAGLLFMAGMAWLGTTLAQAALRYRRALASGRERA
jgi:lipid-A-disaccharide synthase-like uncharacterized protein